MLESHLLFLVNKNVFDNIVFILRAKLSIAPNAKQDHRALGIIDNLAKRIKTILTKTFLVNKNQRWIDKIQNIINIYNNTSHISLDGLTPTQALKP